MSAAGMRVLCMVAMVGSGQAQTAATTGQESRFGRIDENFEGIPLYLWFIACFVAGGMVYSCCFYCTTVFFVSRRTSSDASIHVSRRRSSPTKSVRSSRLPSVTPAQAPADLQYGWEEPYHYPNQIDPASHYPQQTGWAFVPVEDVAYADQEASIPRLPGYRPYI